MLVFKVMKNVRLFWLVGIVLLLAGQSLYAQSKKEKKEQKVNEVKELIGILGSADSDTWKEERAEYLTEKYK